MLTSVRLKHGIGDRFDKLVIIKHIERKNNRHYWLCKCDCGKEIIKGSSYLHDKSVPIKCCGCENGYITNANLIGFKYEKLTVIRFSHLKNGSSFWVCKCDCGNEKTIRRSHIGSTKSCGCIFVKQGNPAFKRLLNNIRNNAKNRKLKLNLTIKQIQNISKQNCYYCESIPKQIMKAGKHEYNYNGIDRKDNNKDYTISNCVPCCKICNYMKSNLSEKEFISHIRKLAISLFK